MKKKKLYELTANEFVLPFYVDLERRNVTTSAADNIPMLHWPNGRWCTAANVYMLELYERGLSRKSGGGTLLTYATNISHLIRFCFYNNKELIDLTDNDFTFFIKTLQGERRARHSESLARDSNSAIAIGRNCIEFLMCVGRFYADNNFIGPKGRIIVQQREVDLNVQGRHSRRRLRKKYWHHRSFPTPDPKKHRLPISTKNVDKLREVVLPASSSIYLRKRRYVTLKLLEVTGGRRYELSKLTVTSVAEAARMAEPALKLITIKNGGAAEESRFLPIARHDLQFLLEFIDKNRRRIIRKTCGLENDDGFLLVSETTGHGLRANTITQEISILCKHAKISEKACPHMFRHRFITKLFVALIEQHNIENVDEFRKALLDTEELKQIVQEWTGHRDIKSLERYIHLAFRDAAGFSRTYNVVSVARAVESFKATLTQLNQEIRSGASPSETALQLERLIEAFGNDLSRLQEDRENIDSHRFLA